MMKGKRKRYFKIFTLFNIILLLFNIVSYFLLTGPGVFHSRAESISMSQLVIIEAPQCSDGIDNDGDGLIDYPDDPGCSSADDNDESDEIIQPEPPLPPTEPPGQGNYNPPTQPPPRIQELPVWINVEQVNNQYISDLPIPYEFIDRLLTFKGRTNVNEAVIFIQLNDQPNTVYTTWADQNGYWEWTTPYILNLAKYELYIWAINPADPGIIAETRFEFAIKEIIVPSPPVPSMPPGATTTPPVIPPVLPPSEPPVIIYPPIVPKEIYQESKEFYNLSIKILNSNRRLYPKEKIVLQTNIVKLKPSAAKQIEIKYKIYNEQKKLISETIRTVTLENSLAFVQNFLTTFNLLPGKYTVEASLTRDNKIFLASDYFLVIDKPLIISGTDLGFTEQQLARGLVLSFLILFLIFIIFCLLLVWEYVKSLKEKPISEQDLEKNDYLDIE